MTLTQPRDRIGRFAPARRSMPELLLSYDDRTLEAGLERIRADLPGVTLIARLEYEGIVLDTIIAKPRGQGIGSEAMRRLAELADQMRLPVFLDPDEVLGTDRATLVRFYTKHGYSPARSGPGQMVRFPH